MPGGLGRRVGGGFMSIDLISFDWCGRWWREEACEAARWG